MTDTNDIMARMEQARMEQEAALKDRRSTLLSLLRTAGATRLTILYDGYGDSGNVNDVTLEPDGVSLSTDDARSLEEYGWDRAYSLHPGFENNEGGHGALTWEVVADKMSLTHSDCVIEHDTTEHEEI